MRLDGEVFEVMICSEARGVDGRVLEATVVLAVAREGREIGALFAVGDSAEVPRHSEPMILDPLAGHPDGMKRVDDPGIPRTLKELAQLGGAFVVSDGGVVLSAARYIDTTSEYLDVPLGLGSRHMAAASVSRRTRAVAVAVSENSMVRVFDGRKMIA